MPRGRTQSSDRLDKGDELEMRVARLWYWEGFFARCGVDLRRHYSPEPLLVTDLDLLAYDLGPSLRASRTIGEVKTGTGRSAPKPLDRIIWLRGLKELVGAAHAELVSSNAPSARARSLARSIGVSAQAQTDIERREQMIEVEAVANAGSHGERAFLERRWVHKHCSTAHSLERSYWFLRSEVWFHDEVTACKRLVGLYRQLGTLWTQDIEDDDARALRWLLAETVSTFTLFAVVAAADAIRTDPVLLSAELGERLSAGRASAEAMRRIASDVDKYVAGLLTAAKAPASIRSEAIGALHPEPPEWTLQFVELLCRLAASPDKARRLPRQLDLLVHERIVWKREVNEIPFGRLSLDDPDAGRLVRLVNAFLRSQAAHIDVVDRALATAPRAAGRQSSGGDPRDASSRQPEAPVQASLLEIEARESTT